MRVLVILILSASVASGCAGAKVADLTRVDASSLFGVHYVDHPRYGQIRRERAHAGVDYRAPEGAPVLAAAEGVVSVFEDPSCGLGVLITHSYGMYTAYCHLQERLVSTGIIVRCGAVIGRIGTTGSSSGVPHVHLGLFNKPPYLYREFKMAEGALDPHSLMAGCFVADHEYPRDKLVLTYPIECR